MRNKGGIHEKTMRKQCLFSNKRSLTNVRPRNEYEMLYLPMNIRSVATAIQVKNMALNTAGT